MQFLVLLQYGRQLSLGAIGGPSLHIRSSVFHCLIVGRSVPHHFSSPKNDSLVFQAINLDNFIRLQHCQSDEMT
jgi:hypothetical protein